MLHVCGFHAVQPVVARGSSSPSNCVLDVMSRCCRCDARPVALAGVALGVSLKVSARFEVLVTRKRAPG